MRYMPYDKREVMRSIRQYIDKERNYRNPSLTSSDVAKALGIARSTLIMVLKEEGNMTFKQLLDKCRIHRARHFVVQNNANRSLETIALLCGYRTVATFRKKYYTEYGEYPNETIARL